MQQLNVVHLRCDAETTDGITYEWLYQHYDGNYTTMSNSSNMSIQMLSHDKEGAYKCVGSPDWAKGEASLSLKIIHAGHTR